MFRAVRSVEGVEARAMNAWRRTCTFGKSANGGSFVFGGAFPCTFEVEERDEEMKMKCSRRRNSAGMGFLSTV